ncbi:MAG: hypothetical protein ACYC7A_10465 [Thermoanaerobaculia bacterium]
MKILVAVLTVLPLIYMALFFVGFFLSMSSDPGDSVVFDHFPIFMVVHFSVILLMFALLIFYVVFLFKTDAVRTDMKALWAVVLFFGGPIAMPVFWYLYVWRSPQPSQSVATV